MFGKLKTGNLFSKKPSGIATIDTPRRFYILMRRTIPVEPVEPTEPVEPLESFPHII